MMKDDVFVVIAAYNESKHIGAVIDKTREFCSNIIVVDDCSKDRTAGIAKSKGAIVLKHIVNMGKGAAVKTGCDFALKNNAKIMVLVDGDGQHEPEEIPSFIRALKQKDIVFGCRGFTKDMPFVRRMGNIFLSKAVKAIYGINIRDTQCGYRALTSQA